MYLYCLALKLNPQNYQAYIQKGIILRTIEQYDEAFEVFD